MMFLACPACLDPGGGARYGLPAEVRCRFTVQSAEGPVDSAMIRCPAGHWFNGAIGSLPLHGTDQGDRGTAAVASSVRPDNLTDGHARLNGRAGLAVRAFPAEPERDVPRPNGAPAYYMGRPARVWINAMRPRHRHGASQHPTDAVTGG
jgi:hypothetical protein